MLKIFETIVYSLLNFLPFMLLAMYPFRKMLRFSKKNTIFIISIISFIQITFGVMANYYENINVGLLSVSSTIIYGGFYFFVIKANIGKKIFTLLMMSNIANFVVMTAKCLEGVFFKELARQSYRWSFSLMTFVVEVLIFIPLFLYFKKEYTFAMEQKTNIYQWRYMWLVPATFYLLWYHNTYFNSLSALEIALKPTNAIFLLLINIGAFFVYNVVVQTVNAYSDNLILESKNHQLTMQSFQYENLKEKIYEARRVKHDFRHHITLLTSYFDKEDYKSLKEYLYSYVDNLPEDNNIIFCENHTINLVLVYYQNLASLNKIDFIVDMNIPEKIEVLDCDIAVLFGNLFENAYEACLSNKSGNKKIIIHGRKEENVLVFTIDNTFDNKIEIDSNNNYYSTKRSGKGIGILSVRTIVEKYNGILRIENKNNIFYVSVMLNL